MARQRHIPNRLRMYRKITSYTQIEVAYILDHKSTNRLSRWESGLAVPNLENLLKLSAIYKTLPQQLYPELHARVRVRTAEKQKKLREKGSSRGSDRAP